ncbi:MAG: cysteine hydrolase family protein [Tistlia sp.]|uniref:cysteine hydrolase family protein n=1 Tax=Tistlia sp. TaxID=3057121 RepID=UPI0034A0D29A
MSAPKTLLAMAGADPNPHAWSSSVLLLIDMQNEYRHGKLPLPGVEPALAEAARLLERARRQQTPVVHVQHEGRAGGAFDPDSEAFALADPVAAGAEERRIVKRLPNAFAGTGLADLLEGLGRKNLIVGGFMTHMCVSSTVRAALDLGYGSTVVAGACATRDLPDGSGGVVSAAELQRAELAALADRFAVVVPGAAETAER